MMQQQNTELKALYVGQIEKDKQEEFRELMDSLSEAYKEAAEKAEKEDKSIGDGKTCMIYNYYDRTKRVESNKKNRHILNGILPPQWAQTWAEAENNKPACIKIIDHVLELSGFKQYLDDNEDNLTTGYEICCCVTYYHNRAGDVGFHQDSLGAELFVSLIYRDQVYGPELKLKERDQFDDRITKIRGMMPEFFIEKLQELYNGVQDGKNVVQWTVHENSEQKPHSVTLREDLIEWIDVVPGPGGIVGFVDELMIHSTPYLQRRKANRDLLLDILKGMEVPDSEKTIIIEKLKNKINEITDGGKDDHYITIDELKISDIKKEEEEEVIFILDELYNTFIERLKSKRSTKKEQYNTLKEYKTFKEKQYNTLNEEYGKYKNSTLPYKELQELQLELSELIIACHLLYQALLESDQEIAELTRELKFYLSSHQLYTKEGKKPEKHIGHTGGIQRRLSERTINNTMPPQQIPATDRRSFLRVWVIALPKQPIQKPIVVDSLNDD